MTPQAERSLRLYNGGSPSTIEQLLKMQSTSVVNELMAHFKARDIKELAIRLSLGYERDYNNLG